MAAIMLDVSAFPIQAISKAVPWSTLVCMNGNPSVRPSTRHLKLSFSTKQSVGDKKIDLIANAQPGVFHLVERIF
jgi:hypothetical protein